MKEHTKNIIILILCCLLTGAVFYAIGVWCSINWISDMAVNRFGLRFNMTIDYAQMAQDLWRYKGALTNG